MIQVFRRTLLPLLFLAAATAAPAQFYKIVGGSISVGATGQFTSPLTTNPAGGTYTVARTGGGTLSETLSNQQQYTTNSTGFLTQFQFHPKPWAGLEFNYGFTRYSERFVYSYATQTTNQNVSVPVYSHEITGAYQFHPKHIPFQPFVNVGGGTVDFLPGMSNNMWRGAGLLETGFDVPTHNKHVGFRVQGRALFYRAPNFYTPVLSTRSWRSTEEPSLSVFYTF